MSIVVLLPSTSSAQPVFASVLPTSRSVQVGTTATAFATIINAGAGTVTGCSLAPLTSVPATFTYQTTNALTNALTGTLNTPVDIAAGKNQTFVFAFTPTAAFAPTDVQLRFACANAAPVTVITGVNTLLLSASTTPVPDMIALAATITQDGIANVDPNARVGVLAVATSNVGSSGAITVTANTGGVNIPLNLSVCETNPTTGACVAAPGASVTTQINANATPTFGIFIAGNDTIPFDPATNRIFVRFASADGVTRGSTSVAARTGVAIPPPPPPVQPPPNRETFTNGSVTFNTNTTQSGDTKTTILTDSSGELVLTITSTTRGLSISFPGKTGSTDITFSNPLPEQTSDFALNRLAAFIAGGLSVEGELPLRFDSPGCDWFPDTQCTLGCCAVHDQCYSANNCGATSWLPFVGSDACKNCNSVAASCITQGCAGVIDSATDNRCFDNRCNMFFDCAGAPQGATSCECTSPCDSIAPSSCGNGTCEVTENATNCAADCLEGAAVNQCCQATNGCPSETPSTCPGDCCCCGLGEVCSFSTNLCSSTRSSFTRSSVSPWFLDYTPADYEASPAEQKEMKIKNTNP